MAAQPVKFALRQMYMAAMKNSVVRDVVYERWNSTGYTDLAQHELMLADRVRVDTYHQAISRLIQPDDIVVDLGTGTGILAMYAARRARRVYAIDHSEFITCAARIAQHNGFDNITFVQENSRAFTPPEKVDVVIHEQMGDDLINENMLDSLLDLKRRIMAEKGRILPARFELYIEPVCLEDASRIPYLWELDLNGVTFDFLEGSPDLEPYKRKRYNQRRLWAGGAEVSHFLSDPAAALAFDLDDLDDASRIPNELQLTRRVQQKGILDGFCIYFRAMFDDDITLSTSPLASPTHWQNRLFRVPQQRLVEGDEIGYHVAFNELVRPSTWTVTLAS